MVETVSWGSKAGTVDGVNGLLLRSITSAAFERLLRDGDISSESFSMAGSSVPTLAQLENSLVGVK
ncbi:MAG: hypothetical protein CL912_25600 [Deltaproteobacteria bacterium]|nr:hypothetical protein [Deltaproteobacteria bacterium]